MGCDNVHIDCSATDVSFVMNSYNDGGWNLKEAKSCLQRKCVLQNGGRYVNAGDKSRIETSQSNSIPSKDSKINIPQPSFKSGSYKIQATGKIISLPIFFWIFQMKLN